MKKCFSYAMTNDMSDILELHLKQVVKVKVNKLKANLGSKRSGCRSFKLDPQTASFSYLRNILAHIFHINGEFVVSYRKDKEEYAPLTSDWDLDAAIAVASKPYLLLTIEVLPIDTTLDEWDIICPADIPPLEQESPRSLFEKRSLTEAIFDQNFLLKLTTAHSQMEHTMHKIQRALSFEYHVEELEKSPLTLFEYENFLDSEGRIANHREFHMSVYQGGVDPSIRPTVWKHLLNVFPAGLTNKERDAYLNSKSEEYYRLRYRWQHLIQAGTVPDVLADITSLVRKDVRRTDRGEKFYSGSDDNSNVRALFNILTTYAVNHPNISYCQGMSDMLSPILYVMQKESHAYICFCGLMRRTKFNFKLDGKSMKLKFKHLRKMIHYYDRTLYDYLKKEEALDLLFCYRWLLLELKREFAYNDMLRVLEVIWGSLPPKPPQKDLSLYDVKFPTATICTALKERTSSEALRWRDDHFGISHDANSFSQSMTINTTTAQTLKKWAIRVRRESIARHIESSNEEEIKLPIHYRKRKYRSYIAGKLGRLNEHVVSKELDIKSCKTMNKAEGTQPEICQSWSCGEVFENRPEEINHALYDAREFLRNQWCYSNTINELQLNNWLNGRHFETKDDPKEERQEEEGSTTTQQDSNSNNRQRHGSSDSNYSTISDFSDYEDDILEEGNQHSRSEGYISDNTSLSRESTLVEDYDDTEEYEDTYSEEESGESEESDDEQVGDAMNFSRRRDLLPPPHILGDGNPFLLFLSVAMIEQHRDEILQKKLDFNELGIYFDKLVRKHKLPKILKRAQKMFKEYLNMGWDVDELDDNDAC